MKNIITTICCFLLLAGMAFALELDPKRDIEVTESKNKLSKDIATLDNIKTGNLNTEAKKVQAIKDLAEMLRRMRPLQNKMLGN